MALPELKSSSTSRMLLRPIPFPVRPKAPFPLRPVPSPDAVPSPGKLYAKGPCRDRGSRPHEGAAHGSAKPLGTGVLPPSPLRIGGRIRHARVGETLRADPAGVAAPAGASSLVGAVARHRQREV